MKYHNKKVYCDGMTFDSKKEAQRYHERGRLLERKVMYFADFAYFDNDLMEYVVEDVKGFKTPEYKLKRKLMLFMHNIRIKET